MRPMRGLRDKRILITGGASGIGAATAARFLEEGSKVVVLDRDASANDLIRKTLSELAGAVTADVSKLKEVQAAFAEAVRLLGGVDVLVNNAGISIRHKFVEITPEEWDRVLAVNLTGVFYMAQTAARHMLERGSGVILQTASTNGIMGYPWYADYNATKAGVIELTKSMALELAPKVRVVAVAPGYVLTPMQRIRTRCSTRSTARFRCGGTRNRRRLRRCLPISRRMMRRLSQGRWSRLTERKRRAGWRVGNP
jgi:meso-butanediol dehydrogenase / (S,S)-butanediol dehydrogenase / diacetyl reductase